MQLLVEAGLLLLTAAASAAVLADVPGPLRAGLVLAFLVIGPGLAWARSLRLRDPIVLSTVAVALSLSLDALVACAMLYGGVWSPGAGFAVLAGLTLAGTAVTALGLGQTPPSPEASG